MKEKTVVIEIDEHGNSSVDLEGFRGNGCADVAKNFQASDVVRKVHNKREFYVDAAVGKRARQQA